MKHALIATLLLGCAAGPAAADTFIDNYLVVLDESQISTTPQGDEWRLTGLPTTDELLYWGDRYVAYLEFVNDERLRLVDADAVYFRTHSVSALQYEMDFAFWGDTLSGPVLLMDGSVTSDISGAAGGTFELAEPEPFLELESIRLELEFVNGAAQFYALDIGLRAASIQIVPEPRSAALLLIVCLTVLGRRRVG